MLKRKQLLTNLRDCDPAQVAEAVKGGVVTMYELSKTGQMSPLLKRRIQALVDGDAEEAKLQAAAPQAAAQPMPEPAQAPEPQPIKPVMPQRPTASLPTPNSQPLPQQQPQPQPYQAPAQPMYTLEPQTYYQPQTMPTASAPKKKSKPGAFSFEGRIKRGRLWLALVTYIVVLTAAVAGIACANGQRDHIFFPIAISGGVLLAIAAWYLLAEGAKRCHDLGHSGWFQFIPFYSLIMLFSHGFPADNEYGPNPYHQS